MFQIFQYEFMQNAFMVGILLWLIWPILWVFLIIRRYTMISDTLSHISLTWVILWLISWYSPIIVTLFYTAFSALIIERFRLTKKLAWDMVLSLILAFNLAIVATAMSVNSKVLLHISSYLFWSIALVSRQDVYILLWLAIFIIFVFYGIKKSLLKVSYDEDNAAASGINVKLINIIFIILVAMLITLAIPITWVLLLSALIIIPIIASTQISWSFKSTIIIAEIISVLSVITWITLSYFYDISASWMITFLLIWFFLFFFCYSKIKNILRCITL